MKLIQLNNWWYVKNNKGQLVGALLNLEEAQTLIAKLEITKP
jgi:hypothetical protein